MSHWSKIALLLVAALCASACEALVSDSATRIAFAVRDGAARLQRSRSQTLVLSVGWQSWPDGCPGSYRVRLVADSDRFPTLGVNCTSGTRSYGTTYYRTFVKVPSSLEVSHEQGEPTTIALRRSSDGSIEVIALR